MRYVATVNVAGPGSFEAVARYRGDLGTARRKAHRKALQIAGRVAMRGGRVESSGPHNWGGRFFGLTGEGRTFGASYVCQVAALVA